jgi:hypothetical protein
LRQTRYFTGYFCLISAPRPALRPADEAAMPKG